MSDAIVDEVNVPFIFRSRPMPIPADLRPGWRLGMVVLLLRECCRRNKSSPTRLHVLSWASLTLENQAQLLDAVNGTRSPDSLLIRIEPSLNRAVDFCVGEGLVIRSGGNRYELSAAGIQLADELQARDDCFLAERRFMKQLGKRVTEDLIKSIFAG
jgi:hypothetical protein